MDKSVLSGVLRQWGLHGNRAISWAPAESLRVAADEQGKQLESELGDLLAHSNRLFKPLCDPLRADAGLNRWLRREEAYSDWLDWVLNQIDEPALVLKILGVVSPVLTKAARAEKMTIDREHVIPDGRLDIVLRFGTRLLIVVEVKTNPGEPTNTAKQSGYRAWMEEQKGYSHRLSVLLAVDFGEEKDYSGFTPLRWADFCIGLRGIVPHLRSRLRDVKTAMIIAFIGAVETNLLQLVAPGGGSSVRFLFYSRTRAHLQKSLRRSHEK